MNRPVVAAPEPWPFPLPTRHRLSNGIEVRLFDLPGQHVVSITVVLDHSLSDEPTAYEGITALVARTLTEGTVTHPGSDFAARLEHVGAAMGADVGHSGIQIMLDVPGTHLAAALPLLGEAVIEPALDPADIRRQIELRLAEIAQQAANSAATASLEYRRAMVAPQFRASRPSGGEADTVAALTPELVRDWAPRVLTPQRATIVIGGDFGASGAIRPDAVVAALEAAFGRWQGTRTEVEHPTPAPGAPGYWIIDRPGSVQADLRLGAWGIDRSDPRWPALRVASYAMGGAFNSRLNAVLREQKGFTYGVRFGFTPLRAGGWSTTQGSFRTEVMGEALATAREILDISRDQFTSAEVEEAKRYLTGTGPLHHATADGVVDQSALQVMMGLEDDYLDRSLEKVLALTPEQVTEAYRSLVDPEQLTCLIVGDATQLVPQLEARGLTATVR